MVVTNDPTVFPCGDGFVPGSQGPGGGGSEPPVNPGVFTPKPTITIIPPFRPSKPKPNITIQPPPFSGPGGPTAVPPTGGPSTGGPARGPTAVPPTGGPSTGGPTTGGPARGPTAVPPTGGTPGGPTTGGPARGPTAVPPTGGEPPGGIATGVNIQSDELLLDQQKTNATSLSVNNLIEEEDYQNIQKGIIKPRLFDPVFNFFKDDPNSEIKLVPYYGSRGVFNREVAHEVAEILSVQNTNMSWDEVTLQNLSDDKLLISLDPKLVRYFQYLRYPGGKPVGVPTLLNVVRRHILEGTLNELDVLFFREASEAQFNQNFELLEQPVEQEYSDRFAIDYIRNKLHTFENNKSSTWRNFQVNRMRPLNEDINLEIQVETLDATIKDLRIPNEGIAIDKLTDLPIVTVPSVGSPDRLNIGNGGGYYVHGVTLQGSEIPVTTKNVIPVSYYSPAPVRMKVLDMLDIDPSITLVASSLSGHHEFVSGDLGASAVKPLFFAINLSSVTGDYVSDSLVENYSATYSLLTASSDIQTHLNNNALNTPMVSIDYRDPLYRYILDTSSFSISLNDFNLNGFKDKGLSSIGSRFIRNLPFGLVITPVAGGRYNPYNGRSILDTYGDTHVRSLSFLPATDSTVDGNTGPLFQYYNLHNTDGVDRVGIAEKKSTQNIGYRYDESLFTKTFYSASSNDYGYSSAPASSYGYSYLLREVVDYLLDTYDTKEITWYDVFSRMPATKVGELFYEGNPDLILDIANGLRNGVKIQNIESGYNPVDRIIPEDSKTIITKESRRTVTTSRL